MPHSARLASGYGIICCSLAFGILLFTGWLAGCSSGNVSSGATSSAITVSVSGASDTLLSTTTQFTATVTGTTNETVAWQVNGVTGGTAATGTISAGGLYTAPTTMPAAQSVSITAVSAASPSVSGSLTENLLTLILPSPAQLEYRSAACSVT